MMQFGSIPQMVQLLVGLEEWVDLHNTASDQLQGKPQCRLCTHGRVTTADWELFKAKAYEWWGVSVPDSAFDRKFLKG